MHTTIDNEKSNKFGINQLMNCMKLTFICLCVRYIHACSAHNLYSIKLNYHEYICYLNN